MGFLLTAGIGVAAQTGCADMELPYSEYFDGYVESGLQLPPCWYATRNYDSGRPPQIDASQHYSGDGSLVLYPGTFAGSHYSMAISPQLAVDSLQGLKLRFYFMASNTGMRLEVGACVDTLRQTRQFVPLDTIHVDQAMRWQLFEVDLASYGGVGKRIAFRFQRALQTDASECWIDDIRVESCGVSNLAVEHIGSTTLTLRFDRFGEGDVQVEYGDTVISQAQSPMVISGLQPQTAYIFTVGCVGGMQYSISATTMEGAGMVPAYYEPFTGGLPAGWRFPAGGAPTVSGQRLRLTPTGGDSCVAVLPLQEAAPITDLNIAVLLAGSGNTRLVVGVMEYADEPESFIPVDTLICTQAEQLRLVSFSTYAGQGNYIALMAIGSGTVSVGKVRVARCLLDNVRLYNLTESEVTIAWDTLVLNADVQLEYGQQGFSLGEGTLLFPSDNPYTLVGLEPATSYDLYLWPACGDSVCIIDKLQFSTFAHSVTPPYCNDFEDPEVLPQGWVGNGVSKSNNSYVGSSALRLAAGGQVSLPLLDGESPDTVFLEFFATGSGTLQVGVADNAYSLMTVQANLTGSGWNRHRITLTGVASRCITLHNTGVWTIDALTLHTAAVTAASVSGVGQHEALVMWQTEGADSISVEYCQVASDGADFPIGSGTETVAADSIRLTGLVAGGYYTLHLWPIGDSASCYPEVLHFRTLADSVAIPFCENFEGISTAGYPDLWRRRSGRGEYPIVSTERNNTGSRSLHFAATSTQHTTAVLPDATGCSTHRTLSFWTNITAEPQGAMLLIGYMSDIDDDATFVAIDTLLFSVVETWQHHEIAITPAPGHLALRLVGGSGETHLFIDDLCIDACAARNVRLGRVQQNSATLSWSGEGVGGVVVYISGAITRTDTFYTSPALIEGLSDDQTYYISVESLCDCGGTGVAYAPGGATNGSTTNKRVGFVLNTLPSATHLPICNTFESISTGRYPSGWRRRGTAAVSDLNYYNGGHSLAIDSGSYIILPQLSSSGPVVVSFYAYSPAASMMSDSAILIGITSNPDSAARMTVLASKQLNILGQWQHVAVSLGSSVASGNFIVIKSADDLYIDNLSVASHGIGDAVVTAAGVISWQQWNSQSVAVEYGPSGFTVGTGYTDTVSTPPYVIPAIEQRQSYDIYLVPIGGGATCQRVSLSLGSSTALPYCEMFDLTPVGGMPMGWNIGRTHDNTPSISVAGGNKILYMKGTANARSIAVLPKLATDSLSDLQLTLNMKSSNSHRAMLLVGEMTSAADPNTFVAHDTLYCQSSGAWYTLRTSLADFSAAGRIALACEASAQNAEVWVDSIGITRGLTPSVSVISARRVQVVLPDGAAEYLEYGPAGFAQGSGTMVHINTSPYTIEGLAPDSSYWFYSLSDSDAVTCLAPLQVSMPVEVELPYCYSRDTLEQLVLPEFSVDSVNQLHLYVSLHSASRVAVGIMEQRGDWGSFVPMDTLEGPSTSHISLSDYRGGGRFVAMTAIGGGNFVIDNMRITPCQLPEIALEEDGAVVVYGSGVVEYEGQRIVVVDSLQITNLTDTTYYEFYTLCDSGDVICGEPISLTTTMSVDLPYCVSLANEIPAGWTVDGTATVASGVLTIAPGASVRLPVMPSGNIVIEFEEYLAARWQKVQLQTEGPSRPMLAAGSTNRRIRNLSVDHCAMPPELEVSQPGNGTLNLSWDSTYGGFYIGYRLEGDSMMTIVGTDVQPLAVSVESDTNYEFFLMCDSGSTSCREPLLVRTLATSVPVPYCLEPDNLYVNPPAEWHVSTWGGYTYFILPQPDTDSLRRLNITLKAKSLTNSPACLVLGAMSDAANPETFDSLCSFQLTAGYGRYFHTLRDYYGAGRFIALRVAASARLGIERLVVGDCAAFGVEVTSHEADHVVLEWQNQGNPTVFIEYGPQGFASGTGAVVSSNISPFLVDGLSPLSNYAFYVTSACPVQDSLCPPITVVDTFFTFTPQGGTGCIDYTDLTASYVSCNSGSYNNPILSNGAIDYGYLSAASRHTVHYDTAERDARTGGLLRTVPEGALSSVRLGNWLAGGIDDPQAESLTYALNVDSGDIDLLVLQYAAVLQDAEHASSLQPRFRLEILNASGTLIDSCGMVDFIANADLGWNQAAEDVLWKDWTTVGLDLTPYAGQTIFIRLTTYDCGEGSHFGYAYFTLQCATKRMATEGCSDVPSNRFTVPSGFNYTWTTNQSDSVISTQRSILVPSDNEVTYYCHLSSIDNPSCGFDMSAFAGARYPLALFDTALGVSGCQLSLQLTDRSTISFDGVNPVGTGEPCETIRWLLPGDTNTIAQQTLLFSDTTTVDITLVAGIAADQCLDTVTRRIHIAYPYPHAAIDGDTERCLNDAPSAVSVHFASLLDWDDTIMYFAPSTDTVIAAIAVDTNGCTDTLLHHMVVHPIYFISDSDSVCSSNLSYSWRDSVYSFTIADNALHDTLRRISAYGCDSTMALSLHLYPSYDIHHHDTVCDNAPLAFFDTMLVTPGSHLHTDTTIHGCDSLVTMHLEVLPTYIVDDPRQVCDSLRWRDDVLYTADTSGVSDSLVSTLGCDSVIVLSLNVFPSYFISDSDSVCASNLAYAWRDTALAFTFADSAVGATLGRTSVHGCDSTMTLSLHLYSSYDIHHYDTVCDNAPLPFFDTTLVTTGNHLHADTTLHGCDSLVTMHLTVFPSYAHIDSRQACDSLRWIDGNLYTADTAGAIDTLPTIAGCDSVLTLRLAVYPSYLAVERDTFCEGATYPFRSHILTSGGYYADTLATIHSCDSILAIDLTERPLPQAGIRVEHDCAAGHYVLHAETDVPFVGWIWGPRVIGNSYNSTDSAIVAAPPKTTQYYLYTAYTDRPFCMSSDSVLISPFVTPRAELKVNPQSLTPDNTHYDAYDIGQDYLYRRWFIDGERYPGDDRHIDGYAPADADTVEVVLVVGTLHCDDTARTHLAIRRHALYVPDAFTPAAETNREFFAAGVNIASFEISIFNRMGALVFHASDINSPWDGRSLTGDLCPTGNYVYQIRYSTVYQPSAYQSMVGTVLLLR